MGPVTALRTIPGFSWIVRCVLALVFVIASIDKIANPEAFAASIEAYRLVPMALVNIVAIVLPWFELVSGVFLIGGEKTRGSAVILLGLLLMFNASMIIAIARGLTINCGCFGPEHASQVGWAKILENTVLILLALYCYGAGDKPADVIPPAREQVTGSGRP